MGKPTSKPLRKPQFSVTMAIYFSEDHTYRCEQPITRRPLDRFR